MIKMEKFINDCLTEGDNQTFNLSRALLAFAVMVYLALSILDVIRTKDFEYQQFGIGMAALLAAGNAGVAFQSRTESKKEDSSL